MGSSGGMKARDWDHGRLMLCSMADDSGEWYGPLKEPRCETQRQA